MEIVGVLVRGGSRHVGKSSHLETAPCNTYAGVALCAQSAPSLRASVHPRDSRRTRRRGRKRRTIWNLLPCSDRRRKGLPHGTGGVGGACVVVLVPRKNHGVPSQPSALRRGRIPSGAPATHHVVYIPTGRRMKRDEYGYKQHTVLRGRRYMRDGPSVRPAPWSGRPSADRSGCRISQRPGRRARSPGAPAEVRTYNLRLPLSDCKRLTRRRATRAPMVGRQW